MCQVYITSEDREAPGGRDFVIFTSVSSAVGTVLGTS